jgi:hypothetical protein
MRGDYVTAMRGRQPDAKNFRRPKVMIGFAESIARRNGGGDVKKTILGLVILASIFLAGCPVSDLHPLYNDSDKNVVEPLLVGKWTSADANDKGSVSFEKASGSGYTMILDDPDKGIVDQYEVHLVRLGGKLFADLRFSSRAHGDAAVDMPFGLISAHVVAQLTVSKDDLGWATMEDNRKNDASGKDDAAKKPTVGNLPYDADDLLVLADTETLRKYVAAHAIDGFWDADHLKRAK